MGAGEMSGPAFTGFPTETPGAAAGTRRGGAIAFVCMDWRHMGELLALDRDGSGAIEDISELFGSPGARGFAELAALDSNGGIDDLAMAA